MSKRKDQEWIDLYEFVKKDILDYTDNIKLPRYIVLRLRGLNKGQFMANNKHEQYAEYPYNAILLTFKIHKQLIKTSSSKIKEEQHKFNYIMTIVESKINDVMMRLQRKQQAEEKAEKIEINNNTGTNYKPKTMNKKSNKLDDLW